ncbi:ribbon-helix-helix protein, CopG family [Kytococcus sedentarius]|uniref:ribbon-helix-helix protein, CopG family n=1 Tax=Kytococcus sedentarius TaxID=1276 RepID=UPI00194FC847|nr:ribbon-helix-helix protein, CopG family [Kytococcus sedentarius]QRO87748.1 ribbon-helix-helix protein, CopG family [Kytococcus sedentarius]
MAMTVRLTDEDARLLGELAAAQGVSRQEATVRAIRETAARRGHESTVRTLSAKARERYADLRNKLGT